MLPQCSKLQSHIAEQLKLTTQSLEKRAPVTELQVRLSELEPQEKLPTDIQQLQKTDSRIQQLLPKSTQKHDYKTPNVEEMEKERVKLIPLLQERIGLLNTVEDALRRLEIRIANAETQHKA